MRIGVKGSTNAPNDNSWVIFDNFKLTYRAKNPEVVTTVLNSKSQELAEFIENNSDAMTEPMLKLAQDAYTESTKTNLNNTAKYDVLIETNEALVAAQENIKLIDAYKAAEQAYDDACTALETVDPNAAIFAEVKEMDEEIAGDAYMDLNNEDLDDLTVRVKALTDKVNAAKADAEMKKVKEEMASASDDDPYDATGFIAIGGEDVLPDNIQNISIVPGEGITYNIGDGRSAKVFLYKRRYRLLQYGKPRYHIRECKTIQEFMSSGTFNTEYRMANIS